MNEIGSIHRAVKDSEDLLGHLDLEEKSEIKGEKGDVGLPGLPGDQVGFYVFAV